jgi:hypothetical protein
LQIEASIVLPSDFALTSDSNQGDSVLIQQRAKVGTTRPNSDSSNQSLSKNDSQKCRRERSSTFVGSVFGGEHASKLERRQIRNRLQDGYRDCLLEV